MVDEGYDDEANAIVRLMALLTNSRFQTEDVFPLPTSDTRSPYNSIMNEMLKDLGYFEYIRKKQAGVPVGDEYPSQLVSLFDRVCSQTPLAFDPECSNGVYAWDYISWLTEFFQSGVTPLRGLYLITDEGEFINYATPENARKFIELANSRR